MRGEVLQLGGAERGLRCAEKFRGCRCAQARVPSSAKLPFSGTSGPHLSIGIAIFGSVVKRIGGVGAGFVCIRYFVRLVVTLGDSFGLQVSF